MRNEWRLHPYPAAYWDGQAWDWDRIVRIPTNPHQFYYYEADLLISKALADSMRVLELGCGTGGSTSIHVPEVARLLATDFSREMVLRAATKFRRSRTRSLPEFAVADACRLPFRSSSFDAVISRGVLLSYVADPGDVLAEAHRVLRPEGRLAVDTMNRIRGSKPTVHRSLCLMNGSPMYVEFFVRAGRQVRLLFTLSSESPYASIARKGMRCERRPRDLLKYVVSEARYEARLFRPEELREMATAAGFHDVQITPLGHLAYTLGWKDKRLKRLASANRRWLSQLTLKLSDHLRPETALHLFVTASRG